jgi:hypothetical protein
LSAPRRIASGRAIRETSRSIKPRVRSCCCQLFVLPRICEEWTLGALLPPLHIPSKPVRPRMRGDTIVGSPAVAVQRPGRAGRVRGSAHPLRLYLPGRSRPERERVRPTPAKGETR